MKVLLPLLLLPALLAQSPGRGNSPPGAARVKPLSLISTGVFASVPACNTHFLYLPVDSAYTQVAGDGIRCHYLYQGWERYLLDDANYSWFNRNGATWNATGGTPAFSIVDTGLSVQWTGRVRTLPHPAPYTYEVFLLAYMGMHATQALGAWITDGTKQIHLEIIGADTNGRGCVLRVQHVANSLDGGGPAFATSGKVPETFCIGAAEVGLRIADSGAALSYSYSLDRGLSWLQLGSTEPSNRYMRATQIGVGGTSVANSALSMESALITSARFQ